MHAGLDDRLSSDEAERLARLRQLLDEAGAEYEVFSHPETVFTAQDGAHEGIGHLAEMAPTLILDTERGPIAAIISGESHLSYKKIKRALGLRNVSLARPDVVLQTTGAQVGTVSLVNQGIPTLVDSRLTRHAMVYGGCGVPRHTLRINPLDLIRVTQAQVFDFAEIRQGET